MQLKDAVAIVTGGAKGYGKGIAAALKQSGAEVWITGRDEKALNAAVKQLGVHAVKADVASGRDWDRVFAAVMKARGRVDILVNNAGAGIKIAPMDQQTDEAIAESIAVNLTGTLYGCRRAAVVMKKQKCGIIVNISSGCAIHAWPGWGPYSAAKAGVNEFAHCLYTELRPSGARVTTITPYWGATDFVEASGIKGHPAGDPETRTKCMQPSEMGDLVVQVCAQPDHLATPDITVQPLIQEIVPM